MCGGQQVVCLLRNNPALSFGSVPSGSVQKLHRGPSALPWPTAMILPSWTLGRVWHAQDRKAPLQTARFTQWRSKSSVIPSEWCQKQCQEHSRHKPESHFSEGTHGAHCVVSPRRFQEFKLSNLVPKERTEFANS